MILKDRPTIDPFDLGLWRGKVLGAEGFDVFWREVVKAEYEHLVTYDIIARFLSIVLDRTLTRRL